MFDTALFRSCRQLGAPFMALAAVLLLANGVLLGAAHASPALLCVGESVERAGDLDSASTTSCPVVLSALGVLDEPEAPFSLIPAGHSVRLSASASAIAMLGTVAIHAVARGPPIRS